MWSLMRISVNPWFEWRGSWSNLASSRGMRPAAPPLSWGWPLGPRVGLCPGAAPGRRGRRMIQGHYAVTDQKVRTSPRSDLGAEGHAWRHAIIQGGRPVFPSWAGLAHLAGTGLIARPSPFLIP